MTLQDFVTIKSGRTFKSGIVAHDEPTHEVIQLRDVATSSNDGINWERLVPVKIDTTRQVNCLTNGQLLLVAKGPSKTAVVISDPPIDNAVANQHFLVISIKNGVGLLPDFLAFYINSLPVQNWLNSNSGGSYQSTLSIATISKLPLPNLNIAQQQVILEGVTNVEKEIALHNLLIQARKSQLNEIAGRLLNK